MLAFFVWWSMGFEGDSRGSWLLSDKPYLRQILPYLASDHSKKYTYRFEPKQISFRLSESEFAKLKQSAKALQISVPAFVKAKAHLLLQFFRPGEITAEKANQLGAEYVKKIDPDHQIAIYTHTDKKHIHNHIVINSVNLETGKKFHLRIRPQKEKSTIQHTRKGLRKGDNFT